jgi:YD repeat-containing protein
MSDRSKLALRGAAAMLSLAGWSGMAAAQPSTSDLVPAQRTTDSRGVDLAGGTLRVAVPLVSFGQEGTTLSASLSFTTPSGEGVRPSTDFVQAVGAFMAGSIRPRAQESGGFYNDDLGTHSGAEFPTGAGFFQEILNIHVNADGSKYRQSFGPSHYTRFTSTTNPNLNGLFDAAGNRGIEGPYIYGTNLMARFVFANGEEWAFNRQYVTVTCTQGCTTQPLARLRSIVSSRGYAIQFLYQSDVAPTTDANAGAWYAPRQVTAYNKAYVYCNESLLLECAAVSALPSATFTYNGTAGTVTITEPGASGGTELIFAKSGATWAAWTSYRHTAVANSTVSFTTGMDNAGGFFVQQLTNADGQSNYTRIVYLDDSGRPPYMYVTATDPAGGTIGGLGQMIGGQVDSLYDELDRIWSAPGGFPYRDWGRTAPTGTGPSVERDGRNNITDIWQNSNQVSPSYFLAYHAAYPADCTNPRTCNRPTAITDANGNVWDYTYAADHGGVLTETAPAVPTRQANGTIASVRPQKRSEYAQRTAWTSNGSGGYVQSAITTWLLVRERSCLTTAASGATCAGGAADEVITDYDYGPDSGPNNLLLRGKVVTAYVGGSPQSLRTCYGYDANGRRISETQPNANLASCP